jgi:hypothetical protein
MQIKNSKNGYNFKGLTLMSVRENMKEMKFVYKASRRKVY